MFDKPHSYKVISFILVNTPVTAELNRNSLYNDRPIPDRDRKPPILFKIFITISLLMYDMKCKGGRLGMSLWDVLPTPLAFMANKVFSNQINIKQEYIRRHSPLYKVVSPAPGGS